MARTRMSHIAGALTAAALLAGPAAAQAATVKGTVVGEPVVHGTKAVIPVLLSAGSTRALHARSVVGKIVVPVKRGIRASTGAITPGDLRIGDRVQAAAGRGVRGARPSVATLRITRRGSVASFAAVDSRLSGATSNATKALDAVTNLKQSIQNVAGPVIPTAGDPDQLAALRSGLLDLRTDLNLLIDDLRDTRDGIDATVAAIQRERPADAARRAAVTRQEEPLLRRLTASRDAADASSNGLQDGVAKLDESINEVGGESAPALTIQATGAASDAIEFVLDLLRKLST